MKYAVIVSGGKQERVTEGQSIKVEKLAIDEGAEYSFEKVLMLVNGDNSEVGAPYVTGAKVTATVVRHARAKKIRIIKMRRRKHSMKRMGHRQWFTELTITGIGG